MFVPQLLLSSFEIMNHDRAGVSASFKSMLADSPIICSESGCAYAGEGRQGLQPFFSDQRVVQTGSLLANTLLDLIFAHSDTAYDV